MKFLVLLIIIFSQYLIYRLLSPKHSGKLQGSETDSQMQSDGNAAVVKSCFVLPRQSNSAKQDDTLEESDKQDEKANIFAAGSKNPDTSVIPSGELSEVFGEEINPEDLEIEPDENELETDRTIDPEEEVEEIRQSMGEIEGYADGFTYDEFEKLVSSDAGRDSRISYILDRNEQSIAHDDDRADGSDTEDENFDINQFLS